MTLAQYVPIKVVGSWATPIGTVDILDGTVRGQEFAAFVRNVDTWSLETDASGNATRVKSSDKSGGLTVTFSASSPTNRKLSLMAQADELLENVVGVLNLADKNGDSEIVMQGAFLVRIPDLSFSNVRGVRAWRWMCKAGDNFIGGHNPA